MNSRMPKLLAIDDDQAWLSQIPLILDGEVEVTCTASIDDALSLIEDHFFDVVLLDLNFDGDSRTGLDVYRRIAAIDQSAEVIVLSGETDPLRLVQTFNAGVSQFIPKPALPSLVRETVRTVIGKREARFRALSMACAPGGRSGSANLIGGSAVMDKLREDIGLAVSSGAKDILLTGETGTGKEVVARAIATLADSSGRMIPIHCGAISDGLAESELFGHVRGAFTGADRDRVSAFEAAGGGYVFLDEIAEMPLNQQAKLLRVLQERRVRRVGANEERQASFRCISATNKALADAIVSGNFREDLFYRIAKFKIALPPLRERIEDIPDLVHYFANQAGKKDVVILDEALLLLQSYYWPGNVRQLQGVIETMLSRFQSAGVIREKEVLQVLPELSRNNLRARPNSLLGRHGVSLVYAEKKRFQKAILDAKGDRTEAARLLNLSRATYFRRAKELGLVAQRKPGTLSQ